MPTSAPRRTRGRRKCRSTVLVVGEGPTISESTTTSAKSTQRPANGTVVRFIFLRGPLSFVQTLPLPQQCAGWGAKGHRDSSHRERIRDEPPTRPPSPAGGRSPFFSNQA